MTRRYLYLNTQGREEKSYADNAVDKALFCDITFAGR